MSPRHRCSRPCRVLSLLLAAVAVPVGGLPTALAGSTTSGNHAFEYRYFAERVDLQVDGSMVAAFIDPSKPGPVAAIFQAHGVAPADQAPSTVPGWTYLVVPEGATSSALLASLERDRAVDFVSPVFVGTGGLPVVVTGDALIGFLPGVPSDAARALLEAHGAGVVLDPDFAGMDGVYRLRTPHRTARAVLDLVNGLVDADPRVVFAQSDMIYWAERFVHIPNDPQFASQWALNQANDHDLDGPEAWKLTMGDPSVVVVVLDSGIDQSHNDISQIPGFNFTNNTVGGGPGGSCDNHGTAVAGCVAATIDNGLGITGIAPGCRVRSGKIFNELSLFGFCLPFLESQDSWTANGINWTATTGARVTNSSWGGGTESAAITTAFNTTRAQGVLHFAASGNGGNGSISYPASIASINAVGAINSSGARASFSQYGPGLFIMAPGEQVLTTDRMGSAGYEGGNYTTIDGTSFASPYAAGVAALVISADPALTPAGVESIMASTAKDRGAAGYDTVFGWGLASAGAAVAAAMPADPPCPGDIDGDGEVGFNDLLALLSAWGPCPGCPEDLDGSGEVGFDDLLALLSAWGGCP
ncbi:MAG: S8 family serine peptidase [Phycisphaeraceae bacterium]|nr:S8 family serine peptidase [Phycisphaeraceae bacterium]